MKKYILLEGVVNNANPVSSHYAIGIPSLTAFHGFLYSLLIDSKINVKNLNTFWIGLRNVNLKEGNVRISNQSKGAPANKILAPPINELSRSLDFDFSIIIELKENLNTSIESVEKKLANKKLAGGSLFKTKLITSEKDSFEELLKKVDSKTIFLKDETYILNEMIDYKPWTRKELEDSGEDFSENEILQILNENREDSFIHDKDPFERMVYFIRKEINHSKKIHKDWYTPINIGFKLLENPTDDRSYLIRGVQNEKNKLVKYKHAYSEPILGIVKAVRKNKMIQLINKENFSNNEFGFKSYFNEKTKQFLILNSSYTF